MRTWQAWLAATAEEQGERYRAYLGAPAEEEAAAMAVQHANLPAPEPEVMCPADPPPAHG